MCIKIFLNCLTKFIDFLYICIFEGRVFCLTQVVWLFINFCTAKHSGILIPILFTKVLIIKKRNEEAA